MSDLRDADQLMERFRAWLEQTRTETAVEEGDSAASGGESSDEAVCAGGVGFLQLVQEFTALRHELKLQTKSARGLEERTEQTLAALHEAAAEFRAVEAKEAEAAAKASEPYVRSLVELDEAVARGRLAVENTRRRIAEEGEERFRGPWAELSGRLPTWKRWLCRRWLREVEALCRRQFQETATVLDAMENGYLMLQNRLQKNLAEREISRIECLGRTVDPHCVTVVEAVDDPSQRSGTVVEVVRPGYFWKGDVYRFAEVRAVRERRE
jgi:molecular chaperone GrpE